ncbi:MAG: phosphatase PAP2 family protein [Candidatus Moranbacteria bacterium]|nr:phosphatase PAP2 family protein [Candidatus Moranbacteria bacterium]
MIGIFHNFFRNIQKIFSPQNLLWHLLAIALTYILVIYGFDWRYFQLTRSPALRLFFWPAVELGAFVPLFGILIFYLVSAARKSPKMIGIALALGQAALLGFLTSEFYKFFTGRPGPPGFRTQDFATDISRVFHFGLDRGGLFFGWPSSHTTIAFAMATALAMLFPKNKIVKYLAIFYALYIGIGVSLTIHWFSDFAAGIIFGSLIGVIAGKSFRERIAKT